MGFSGFRGGVLRAILRRRRGANGRFCRGIQRFLGSARVRCGDSAHGGRCRAVGAKKFLKKGAGKGEKSKNWGVRGAGRWRRGTLYRARGAIFRRDF